MQSVTGGSEGGRDDRKGWSAAEAAANDYAPATSPVATSLLARYDSSKPRQIKVCVFMMRVYWPWPFRRHRNSQVSSEGSPWLGRNSCLAVQVLPSLSVGDSKTMPTVSVLTDRQPMLI